MDDSFKRLIEIMELLRGENGCPWDREQSHETLASCALEEAYEVVEAINEKDFDNLREELGDLLLQIVFHATIAKEDNRFTIKDVIDELNEKLIRRHPHVFKENIDINKSSEVEKTWDEIKKEEKKHRTCTDEIKSVPKALPALIRATKIQKKAAKYGFEFSSIEDVFGKIDEEVIELKNAYKNDKIIEVEEEIGDLLFSIVNFSRFFKINAENSLTNATEKFINRFEGIEKLAQEDNKEINTMSLKELDYYWNRIKEINNNRENDC